MDNISQGIFIAYVIFCISGFIIGEAILMIIEQHKKGEISDEWYRVVPPSWAVVWITLCITLGIILVFVDIILPWRIR